jgi:hypothetical protein
MKIEIHEENETLTQIETLLVELSEAQRSYDEWRTTQPSDIDQARAAWLSIKDRQRMYDAEAVRAWKAQEPGLASKTEVISVKQKIAKLQSELVDAQGALRRLVDLGTPFAVYQNAVLSAEGFIPGFIHRLRKQRVEKVLLDTYGTTNTAKLPRAMTDVAKLHPSVAELELLPSLPRLSVLRESQITEAALSRQHDAAVKALENLRELMHPSNA